MCVVRVHDLISEKEEIRYIFLNTKRDPPGYCNVHLLIKENESLVIIIINLTKLGIELIYV